MFAKLAVSLLALTSFVVAQPAKHARAAHLQLERSGYKQDANLLEPYEDYHRRFIQLDCSAETDHSAKSFYGECCHPLKKGEKLSSRHEYCDPNSSYYEDCPSTSSSVHHQPTPTTTKHTTTHHTTSHKPTPTKPSHHDGGSQVFSGGYATFFYQNGVAGACGTVHSDDALIAAIDKDRYGNLGQKSDNCGRKIHITNKKTGASVDVLVADACPTCANSNSIDLSKGAFLKLASLSEGMVEIEWSWI